MAQKAKYLHGQKGKNTELFSFTLPSQFTMTCTGPTYFCGWTPSVACVRASTSYLTVLTRIPLLAY